MINTSNPFIQYDRLNKLKQSNHLIKPALKNLNNNGDKINDDNKINNSLKSMYNEILSLLEEELYSRHVGNDIVKNNDKNRINPKLINQNKNTINQNMINQTGGNKYIPGKFDIIKHSFNVPLDIALKGTIERQQLFMKENKIM